MTADELSKLLDELGTRLGPTGAHVFDLAVRQVYIQAAASVFGAVVILVGTGIAIALFRHLRAAQWARWEKVPDGNKQYPSLYDRPGNIEVVMASFGVAAAMALAVVVLTVGLAGLLNPEYAAIRDLLGRIR